MGLNTPAFRNELPSALPADELDQLRPNLHPVTFALRQVPRTLGRDRWVCVAGRGCLSGLRQDPDILMVS